MKQTENQAIAFENFIQMHANKHLIAFLSVYLDGFLEQNNDSLIAKFWEVVQEIDKIVTFKFSNKFFDFLKEFTNLAVSEDPRVK